MTIQLAQIYKNDLYKDDMYVTISNDSEIENLLYLKFYSNINNITVELLQTAKKEVIRKILLMEHIDKIIYKNYDGTKEEVNASRKLVIKIPEKGDSNIISDDTIIRFQQILDICNNIAVVQSLDTLSDDILSILQKNDTEYIRIMDFGNNKYSIQQIKTVKFKINEYIEAINVKDSKTEKFMELYNMICNNLSIDELGASYGNICDLIYNKTTVEGFAEILKYFLDEIQITNQIITGKLSNGDIHYWNQVKIDYVWYNVDLALDVKRHTETNELKYCLKCDKDFYEDHIALSQNIEICSQNSAYHIAKEIEKTEGFISRLFKKLVKIVKRKNLKKLNTGRNVY